MLQFSFILTLRIQHNQRTDKLNEHLWCSITCRRHMIYVKSKNIFLSKLIKTDVLKLQLICLFKWLTPVEFNSWSILFLPLLGQFIWDILLCVCLSRSLNLSTNIYQWRQASSPRAFTPAPNWSWPVQSYLDPESPVCLHLRLPPRPNPQQPPSLPPSSHHPLTANLNLRIIPSSPHQ